MLEKALRVAVLMALAACNDGNANVPSPRFTIERITNSRTLYLVCDTYTGREYLSCYDGGFVELTPR